MSIYTQLLNYSTENVCTKQLSLIFLNKYFFHKLKSYFKLSLKTISTNINISYFIFSGKYL